MAADTTTLAYWLNWRFLLCAIWVLSPMVVAAFLIWRYEGKESVDKETDEQQSLLGTKESLYEDEAWRPCLKQIHPAWLLLYRIVSFFLLLAFLIANVAVDGFGMFFYYTQWTFALVTIYFGLGSLLSIYGCYKFRTRAVGDLERLVPRHDEFVNGSNTIKSWAPDEQHYVRQKASVWGYIFQILFQMNAGAVLLTDTVYWCIIFPLIAAESDFKPSIFVIVFHSVNAIVLLGDAILNSLRFPWFRMAYFILWTGIFVVFQWILHVFVSMWWPYPILDLSSPYAPLWYLAVALMHIPCYAIFGLLIRTKHYFFSRLFLDSYHCTTT